MNTYSRTNSRKRIWAVLHRPSHRRCSTACGVREDALSLKIVALLSYARQDDNPIDIEAKVLSDLEILFGIGVSIEQNYRTTR